ncbi:CPBP family intramembrane glutamic endopeptidase [Bradyrhizobium lablabi]|uniref:CPBP family intramembrane glutamic endopeptidase n=1 Tax=Bradyrhizobium lablabi TaxID=722472 RepID=UPI001BA9FDCE|nr:CPBP family intramembrane glutamic endopeptidase [Bradyrhizobium lablabi]MBR0695997.1 CPBP family intramembrane metalloprotease [Bradyrhizobium lablabi]
MDALNPELPPAAIDPAPRPPRVWKFWGTALWGVAIFGATFLGQVGVIIFFVMWHGEAVSIESITHVAASGLTISLSVVAGLPMVLLALWIAILPTRMRFSDYLGLHWTSWKNVIVGVIALAVLIGGWDVVSRAAGREVSPGFMGDVLKSAQAEGALWLLVVAFAGAAPIWEELFARGWLFRGWSESFLGPYGAILLSSIIWAVMHLQYDWFFLCEVLSIGLLFGYLRFRTGSTWLTIVLHGLNNLAATIQTWWLAGQ